jgi:hypothetical protein
MSWRTKVALLFALSLACAALFACGPSKAEIAAQQRDECFANEQQIKMAMNLVHADTGFYPDFVTTVNKLNRRCPSGGTYTWDENSDTVSCTVHGHK